MTSTTVEKEQTPRQMLLALKKDMNSLKDEENSLKAQLVLLNEQFQSLVKSAAEIYPEVLDEEFPKKAAARKRNISPYKPLRSPDGATGKPIAATRTPSYTRSSYRSHDSPHKRPTLDLKRFPRRYARMTSEEAAAKIQEQFENNGNSASGIDARKIRSSLPNSPTDEHDETVLDPANTESSSSDDERRKRLKKKMIESRKVDVVHLGSF
ncbi:hypothetical protein ACROYT_G036061 [Oculina patagonica]